MLALLWERKTHQSAMDETPLPQHNCLQGQPPTWKSWKSRGIRKWSGKSGGICVLVWDFWKWLFYSTYNAGEFQYMHRESLKTIAVILHTYSSWQMLICRCVVMLQLCFTVFCVGFSDNWLYLSQFVVICGCCTFCSSKLSACLYICVCIC